ncbi:TPA_asm: hypothetical protein ES702_05920 [Lokiarchaeia virus SkuldV3]|uniref:Uncharacterized protein n=1 Tax=Lokiarchaeia virus SkuldV3 TaxID=2983915 RepID=A0A9N6YJ53_9VIRU|nr:hypothetical protein QKT74_gp17 [Lokiarchaeia virus SkuldV3]DAZ90957.1 TPA_asm: hypothetical protein ES702_05920 [Lokiarchaeia virus SkuldV3]
MSKIESLYERLKIAFQTNLDEDEYIRDSEVSHIYDKKQGKYLDFYHKRNQNNLHALFQTEIPEVLSKEGFYPLSLDEQLRLKISHANLDKLSFDESNNLLVISA